MNIMRRNIPPRRVEKIIIARREEIRSHHVEKKMNTQGEFALFIAYVSESKQQNRKN